jgi:hypothetical protein
LCGDLPMRVAGGLVVASQAPALGLTEGGRLGEEIGRFLCPGLHATAHVQQSLFSLAHQLDEDFALAPALPAKAPHDLLEVLAQLMHWVCQCGGGESALPGDPLDELQAFFCALYSVVASVTR